MGGVRGAGMPYSPAVSIPARILQIFFMLAGLAGFITALALVLVDKPSWSCEVNMNDPRHSRCEMTNLAGYPLIFAITGVGMEVMSASVAAGARRRQPRPGGYQPYQQPAAPAQPYYGPGGQRPY